MATHSSILAGTMPWIEEPGGLQSMEPQQVRHNLACAHTHLDIWSSNTKSSSLVAQRLKHLPAMWEIWVRSLGQEDPLEKEMATHSSILAWRIPWTEEPGGLQSMGLQRVGHNWVTSPTQYKKREGGLYFLWNVIITGGIKLCLIYWKWGKGPERCQLWNVGSSQYQ